MDGKVLAIMLRATDSGDYDKRICLLTAEGRLFATLKGVRKPKARLKYAAQPFALCEYELVERSGRYTVTGATPIEDMFELTVNPEKYAAAALCTEIADKAEDSLAVDKLFVALLKTLKALTFTSGPTQLIVAKYVQKVLADSGFITVQRREVTDPKTPSAMLDYIAYKSLDGVEGQEFARQLMLGTVRLICSRFASVYETSLNALSVYEKMSV